MKIGISSYSFSKHMRDTGCDLFEVCRLAREIGYDAIEFIELGAEDPMATAKELRAYCASIGLEIASHTIGADFLNTPREELLEKMFRYVDIAEALGAPLLRHDVCYKLPEGMTWEGAIPVMVPLIREVTEYARTKGIRTCSENHGYIFQDSERMEALIRAVDNDNYGWLVDVGNFLCADEYPLEGVRRALPYAIHAHVKDFLYRKSDELYALPEGFFNTRNGNLLRGTVLGHGDVPVAACVKLLREVGYDGVLSLEFEGAEENLPALKMGYAYLCKLAELPVEKA
ncbi:MAG: sugar phosphate isomerase/epimerase [Ruminococcaceae bacterium]|nr:sugar phosphate isomerase/epimerase [Oscillospiraceae bacterium]